MAKMTMVEAINLARRQEMAKDDAVVLLGQDIGPDGGVFRVTEGLYRDFGEARDFEEFASSVQDAAQERKSGD